MCAFLTRNVCIAVAQISAKQIPHILRRHPLSSSDAGMIATARMPFNRAAAYLCVHIEGLTLFQHRHCTTRKRPVRYYIQPLDAAADQGCPVPEGDFQSDANIISASGLWHGLGAFTA